MDGVICNIDSNEYSNRSPIMETREIMIKLMEEGNTVIIHTGRHIDNLKVTQKWLSDYDFKYSLIQFGKPVADIYIDDKGWRFDKWTEELKKRLV